MDVWSKQNLCLNSTCTLFRVHRLGESNDFLYGVLDLKHGEKTELVWPHILIYMCIVLLKFHKL